MTTAPSKPPRWEEVRRAARAGERARILIVDDEENVRALLKVVLDDPAYLLQFSACAAEAMERIRAQDYDLAIVDKNLPDGSGLDLLREAQKLQPQLAAIVITAYSSYDTVVEAMRLSVFDYIEKPFQDINLVREKVREVLSLTRRDLENRALADCVRESYLARESGEGQADPGEQERRFQQAIAEVADPLQRARASLREAAACTDREIQMLSELNKLLDQAWGLLWKVLIDQEKR
jgi:DNA-binding NtrC family response regulator